MTPERFRAASTAAALALVKAACGPDAVLVATRTHADGTVEIEAAAPPEPRRALDDPRVELLVGLPGDGKTTVLGKLALAARRGGARIGVVSTDTHRLGAAAEIDAIGRALDVPVARVVDTRGLAAALATFADLDRVVVDTTGAGLAHAATLAELAALAEVVGAQSRRTLVVAATTAPAVVAATLDAFAVLAPTASIVTKADLAPADAVASQISGHGVVVTAVSSGRRLTDSLVPTGRGGLARRLLAA
ncbi:MAG TPA: hypothetical protein VMS22_17790 [Candidatus Eisenbacteria bacterium]|nr:hypothetical protein [Candidatus Eisenbacteria bacterium]